MIPRLKRFKLLLDEMLPRREKYPRLNHLHDVKHIVHNYHKSGITDMGLLKLARQDNRIKWLKVAAIISGSISAVIFLTLSFIVFWVFRQTHLEKICQQQAYAIVKDKWGNLLEMTSKEKTALGVNTGEITWGYREYRNCLQHQKFFFLF